MSAVAIILIVLAVIVVALAVGGAVATARRTRAQAAELRAQVEEANQHLARAHADDKGWQRETMEAAAREALAARFGSVAVEDLHLVQVVDRPGTDQDQAVFRAQTADGDHTVTLGRRDGAWVADSG